MKNQINKMSIITALNELENLTDSWMKKCRTDYNLASSIITSIVFVSNDISKEQPDDTKFELIPGQISRLPDSPTTKQMHFGRVMDMLGMSYEIKEED